ncbi:hypothetical protein ScalyP_jg6322 [Parmales sp. scaly parma]|nr:hypothetical protein ScalyP_jg6322 [Parmales sp. scaly parma]
MNIIDLCSSDDNEESPIPRKKAKKSTVPDSIPNSSNSAVPFSNLNSSNKELYLVYLTWPLINEDAAFANFQATVKSELDDQMLGASYQFDNTRHVTLGTGRFTTEEAAAIYFVSTTPPLLQTLTLKSLIVKKPTQQSTLLGIEKAYSKVLKEIIKPKHLKSPCPLTPDSKEHHVTLLRKRSGGPGIIKAIKKVNEKMKDIEVPGKVVGGLRISLKVLGPTATYDSARVLLNTNGPVGANNDNDNFNDNFNYNDNNEFSNDNSNTNTYSVAVDPAPAPAPAPTPTTTTQTMASLFSGPSPPEPTSGGSLVQFRLPTGNKYQRRFEPTATVRDMFVVAVGMDAEIQGGRDFVLTDTSSRPPRDLREFVEQGIEGTGLNGCAVFMRYLD